MNNSKSQIPELPKVVGDALFQHVTNTDIGLSSHDIQNAWIKFSNTLDVVESQQKSLRLKKSPASLLTFWPKVLPIVGFGLILFFIAFGDNNYNISEPVILTLDKAPVQVNKVSSKEYELSKPEKFSEMVKYVGETEDARIAKNIDSLPQDSLAQSEFDKRLTSELDQSLRLSFRDDTRDLIDSNLNSRSLRVNGNNSAHLVFVANN